MQANFRANSVYSWCITQCMYVYNGYSYVPLYSRGRLMRFKVAWNLIMSNPEISRVHRMADQKFRLNDHSINRVIHRFVERTMNFYFVDKFSVKTKFLVLMIWFLYSYLDINLRLRLCWKKRHDDFVIWDIIIIFNNYNEIIQDIILHNFNFIFYIYNDFQIFIQINKIWVIYLFFLLFII